MSAGPFAARWKGGCGGRRWQWSVFRTNSADVATWGDVLGAAGNGPVVWLLASRKFPGLVILLLVLLASEVRRGVPLVRVHSSLFHWSRENSAVQRSSRAFSLTVVCAAKTLSDEQALCSCW